MTVGGQWNIAPLAYETTMWPQGKRVFTKIAQDCEKPCMQIVEHTSHFMSFHPNVCFCVVMVVGLCFELCSVKTSVHYCVHYCVQSEECVVL